MTNNLLLFAVTYSALNHSSVNYSALNNSAVNYSYTFESHLGNEFVL